MSSQNEFQNSPKKTSDMPEGRMQSDSIYIQEEDGWKRLPILFTFDSEDFNHKYVVFQDPDEDPDLAYAVIYTEDGELFPIEDEDEWKMAEEVMQSYRLISDEEEE